MTSSVYFLVKKILMSFFTLLDSRHPIVRFTFEEEKDNKIIFSDVCINKSNHSFCTIVFSKSTSIGLYTNILSLSQSL